MLKSYSVGTLRLLSTEHHWKGSVCQSRWTRRSNSCRVQDIGLGLLARNINIDALAMVSRQLSLLIMYVGIGRASLCTTIQNWNVQGSVLKVYQLMMQVKVYLVFLYAHGQVVWYQFLRASSVDNYLDESNFERFPLSKQTNVFGSRQ